MHDDYDLRQEQLNKASLLSSKKFLENLLEKFITNVVHSLFTVGADRSLSSGERVQSFISKVVFVLHVHVISLALQSHVPLPFLSGPWNRSLGHQLLTGLLNVRPLRPLQ